MTTLDWLWTGILTGLAAAYITVCLARRGRPKPVRWEIDGGVLTFDRRLTEAEMEEIRSRWLERYGKPGTANHEPIPPTEETPGA
jgi:hypothetical protein